MSTTAPPHVLITTDAVGGVWTFTRTLAATLVPRGVRFTVAVLGPAPTDEEARALTARPGVTLHHHPGALEWMPGADADVENARRWLADLARRTRPDVAHVNGYAYATADLECPVLVTAHSCVCSWWRAVHGTEAPASIWWRYRERVQAGLDAATLVAAPTAAMLDALGREYQLRSPAVVVPNGSPACPHAAAPRAALVFAAGRAWDPAKNLASLAAVARPLCWPVWIAGPREAPGSPAPPLGDAHWLGQLEPASVQALMRRAAIYALPARYEPFGLSVLEAARAGCALVLGDIPSLRELWDGAACFVPPDDHSALLAALQGLIADSRTRERLAHRSRARADRFTATRCGRAHLELYLRLLDRLPVAAQPAVRLVEGLQCA
jgi:glycosyltransferase involved in cell wall biosynthesis